MKATKPDTFPLIVKKGHASAKIYKGTNRGKDIFTLSYLSPTGRVRSNFADLAEAKREADTVVTKLARGDIEATKLTGRDAQIYFACAEALKHTGISPDVAAREFAQAFDIMGFDGIIEAARHYKNTVANGLPDITVEEAASRWFVAKQGEGMSLKYLKDIKLHTRHFADTFRCQLKAITADQLQDYFSRLKTGPRARNNRRTVVISLFNYAKRQGWLRKNESTAADALGAIKIKNETKDIFTPAEMAALLTAAPERFRVYLALIAFGGLRADEITDDLRHTGQDIGQLRWEDIDFKRNAIVVSAKITKTIARKIPMQPNLRAWLEPFQGRTGLIYNVKPEHDRRTTCERAGVKWRTNAHRHSFASYRLEQTKNAAQVSLEMGNSPKMVLRQYADLVHAEDAEAYWNIYPATTASGKVVPMISAPVHGADSGSARSVA